jgi:hypothetical protein
MTNHDGRGRGAAPARRGEGRRRFLLKRKVLQMAIPFLAQLEELIVKWQYDNMVWILRGGVPWPFAAFVDVELRHAALHRLDSHFFVRRSPSTISFVNLSAGRSVANLLAGTSVTPFDYYGPSSGGSAAA